jgi:kynurenine formamidase
MLNLLTPEVVAAAAKEITSGVRISLDLPLDTPRAPSYGRATFEHKVFPRLGKERPVNDDMITFNTQSSTQWDGFRHFGYFNENKYFNNRSYSDIYSSSVLGTDAWVKNGGIVGRGVLLDYASYAEKNSIPLTPFESSFVLLSHLKEIVHQQKITFRQGDILLVRTGFTAAYNALSIKEQEAIPERPTTAFAGVESTKEMLEWLWENQFAAVAGDQPAWESSPVGREGINPETVIHQWLLGGWGMPIGEMFNLEELAEHCKNMGRWSFFLSSVPLNVPGGVASPPNAVAIF